MAATAARGGSKRKARLIFIPPFVKRICENPWAECSARTNTWHSAIFPPSVCASQSVGRQAGGQVGALHSAMPGTANFGTAPACSRIPLQRSHAADDDTACHRSRNPEPTKSQIYRSLTVLEGGKGIITQLHNGYLYEQSCCSDIHHARDAVIILLCTDLSLTAPSASLRKWKL